LLPEPRAGSDGRVRATASIAVVLAIAACIAWAGSYGGAIAWGVPVFALCGAVAFAVNWAAFVPAWVGKTERYFDLTGSLTYLVLLAVALGLGGRVDARSLLLALLVALWAVRLGTFLFARIRADGSDGRFDRIKTDFGRFATTWTLQALWVFLTLACALAAITSATRVPLGSFAAVGTLLWIAGFGVEVVADQQKRAFRADPANDGRFITTGLWAWSQHPNYFGEITLWLGVALVALPALTGWQHATLISPVFVYLLLTRVSGVPLLEARAARRWGDDPEFSAYSQRTPRLVLRPPR
jgi:steroid 5-alpha reductase family enzyme